MDISGSRIYAGSGRPPWVPDYEWKVFSLKNKQELTRQWKASIADDVAKARAKAAQELLTPHASSSSSSSAAVAVATPARSRLDIPLLCVDELTKARAAHAIEIWYATICTVATGCGKDGDDLPEDPGLSLPLCRFLYVQLVTSHVTDRKSPSTPCRSLLALHVQ